MQFLAVGDVDGVVRVFFLATVGTPDTQIHRIDIRGDYPSALTFTPDSSLLVIATSLAKTISFYTIPAKYSITVFMRTDSLIVCVRECGVVLLLWLVLWGAVLVIGD